MFGNSDTTIPSGRNIGFARGHYLIGSTPTLALSHRADTYTVEGNGTVTGLPAYTRGTTVLLTFTGTPTFTYSAKLIVIGGASKTFAAGDGAICVSDGDGVWRVYPLIAQAASGLPRGHITGLTLSVDGTTPNTKIDVAAGKCRDDSDAVDIALSSGVIDCTATGENGMPSGDSLPTSGTVHIFGMAKADGTVSRLAATSLTPTLPSGYTRKRRIGSLRTDSSAHLIGWSQNGDEFLLAVPIQDVSGSSNQSTTSLGRTLSVPSGIEVWAKTRTGFYGATNAVFLQYAPDVTSVAGGGIGANYSLVDSGNGGGGAGEILTRTNTSAQIYTVSSALVTLSVTTIGWIDDRGRLA